MVSFWGLVCLVGYGCFHGGGMVTVLDGWLGANNPTFVEPFPLLGSLKASTTVGLAVLLIASWTLFRILNRPRVADALIDTEAELQKVTWPTWPETWAGTLAVTGMVCVLFAFLTIVDLVLTQVMGSLWGKA
jgi:preprotein translocase SecE subunit